MWVFEGPCAAIRFELMDDGEQLIETTTGRSTPDHRLEEYSTDWFAKVNGAPVEVGIACTRSIPNRLAMMDRMQAAELPKRDDTVEEVIRRLRFINDAPLRSHVSVRAARVRSGDTVWPFRVELTLPPFMFDHVWSLAQFGVSGDLDWMIQLGACEHEFPSAPLGDSLVNAFIHGHEQFEGHELRFQVRPSRSPRSP